MLVWHLLNNNKKRNIFISLSIILSITENSMRSLTDSIVNHISIYIRMDSGHRSWIHPYVTNVKQKSTMSICQFRSRQGSKRAKKHRTRQQYTERYLIGVSRSDASLFALSSLTDSQGHRRLRRILLAASYSARLYLAEITENNIACYFCGWRIIFIIKSRIK